MAQILEIPHAVVVVVVNPSTPVVVIAREEEGDGNYFRSGWRQP